MLRGVLSFLVKEWDLHAREEEELVKRWRSNVYVEWWENKVRKSATRYGIRSDQVYLYVERALQDFKEAMGSKEGGGGGGGRVTESGGWISLLLTQVISPTSILSKYIGQVDPRKMKQMQVDEEDMKKYHHVKDKKKRLQKKGNKIKDRFLAEVEVALSSRLLSTIVGVGRWSPPQRRIRIRSALDSLLLDIYKRYGQYLIRHVGTSITKLEHKMDLLAHTFYWKLKVYQDHLISMIHDLDRRHNPTQDMSDWMDMSILVLGIVTSQALHWIHTMPTMMTHHHPRSTDEYDHAWERTLYYCPEFAKYHMIHVKKEESGRQSSQEQLQRHFNDVFIPSFLEPWYELPLRILLAYFVPPSNLIKNISLNIPYSTTSSATSTTATPVITQGIWSDSAKKLRYQYETWKLVFQFLVWYKYKLVYPHANTHRQSSMSSMTDVSTVRNVCFEYLRYLETRPNPPNRNSLLWVHYLIQSAGVENLVRVEPPGKILFMTRTETSEDSNTRSSSDSSGSSSSSSSSGRSSGSSNSNSSSIHNSSRRIGHRSTNQYISQESHTIRPLSRTTSRTTIRSRNNSTSHRHGSSS